MTNYPNLDAVLDDWLEGDLSPGDLGPAVSEAQALLVQAGYKLTIDGKLGPKTRSAIEVAEQARQLGRIDIDRVHVDGVPVVSYEDVPSIDARPTHHYGRRSSPPKILVLHWPGYVCSARDLGALWKKTSRTVSSHLGVDEREIVQYLPLGVSAWHAEWINRYSVGVDICQSPVDDDLAAEQRRGLAVSVADNPTGRGAKHYLSLDPRVASNARKLVMALCAQLGIPLKAPRDGDGKVRHDVVFDEAADLAGWSGVIGHHHCNPAKWDVGVWWRDLFAGTPLG